MPKSNEKNLSLLDIGKCVDIKYAILSTDNFIIINFLGPEQVTQYSIMLKLFSVLFIAQSFQCQMKIDFSIITWKKIILLLNHGSPH